MSKTIRNVKLSNNGLNIGGKLHLPMICNYVKDFRCQTMRENQTLAKLLTRNLLTETSLFLTWLVYTRKWKDAYWL